MKRLLAFAFALLLLPAPIRAVPYAEFENRVRNELIKPFALDLGGLLGSFSFYTGRSLGFPGFEVGTSAAFQTKPDKNNLILRGASVRGFGFPVLHASVGLPMDFDIAVHGMKFQGVSLLGGGLRYCVFKSGLVTKFLPSIGLSAFGDKIWHQDFHAEHLAGNIQASWNLPIVTPWLGAGLDSTRLKVGSASTPGTAGLSATAVGSRLAAGLEVTPFPFLRIDLAALLLHGIPGGRLSAGIKF